MVFQSFDFAISEFRNVWFWIIPLAIGFGIQIALYQYIKSLMHNGQGMGKVVGVSGATSTTAMISCCAHYLVNLVPVLGVTGLVTFVTQYQVELFWFGLASNILGITYMTNRLIKLRKSYG